MKPITPLQQVSGTLNRLAAAAGLMNLDYLGTREEACAFQDEILAAHHTVVAAMILIRNHPELGDEFLALIDAENQRSNPPNVVGSEVESS